MSLTVIQGVMHGLQKGLISRSKAIHGDFLVDVRDLSLDEQDELKKYMILEKIPFLAELETEVMIKKGNFAFPAKIHGVDETRLKIPFLEEKDFKGIVMGSELAHKLKVDLTDEVQLITPEISDSLMGEVPRFVTASLSDYLYTELPEVDEFEAWVRLPKIQNLLKRREYSHFRLFSSPSKIQLAKFKTYPSLSILSWEEMNSALVWSLNLETRVMLVLFGAMSFLVSIAITTGLMIFFDKIKKDLMSFWILGLDQSKIMKLCFSMVFIMSFITVIMGLGAGVGILEFLRTSGHRVMPDVFIERNFPVEVTLTSLLISFFIPFLISLFFSYLSFEQFKKENSNFLKIVRSLS